MTEALIQEALHKHFSSHPHRINNTFMFPWESDFFSISQSGYTYEVEIKCSFADFQKDFEKPKHKLLASNGKPYTIPGKEWHHGHHCSLTIVEPDIDPWPNRFFFACPRNVIPTIGVPPYAGLLFIHNSTIEIIRPAPLLHKRKINFTEKLMSKYYWDNFKLQRQIESITNDRDAWKEKAIQLGPLKPPQDNL